LRRIPPTWLRGPASEAAGSGLLRQPHATYAGAGRALIITPRAEGERCSNIVLARKDPIPGRYLYGMRADVHGRSWGRPAATTGPYVADARRPAPASARQRVAGGSRGPRAFQNTHGPAAQPPRGCLPTARGIHRVLARQAEGRRAPNPGRLRPSRAPRATGPTGARPALGQGPASRCWGALEQLGRG
jgi:hypothetical protein